MNRASEGVVSAMKNPMTKAPLRAGAVLALGLAFLSGSACATEEQRPPSRFLPYPTSANFQNAPGVPECTSFDVLRGDMAATPSGMMVRMTSGCVVPYQWHTASEELIMLRGEVEAQFLGESVLNLENGAYLLIPTGKPHRFRCSSQESCVMYVGADAAFDIHFVDTDGESISPEEVDEATRKYAKEDWGSSTQK